VPLFVEEITKTVLESGDLRETVSAYELTGPLSRLRIPSTLYDSLMARLDRLQPVKEVAQTAACIGRDFDYRLLKAVSPLGDAALQDALERLTSAELIFRRGVPPDSTYIFKHALVRDAAYENLLKTRRQTIHAKLVEALKVIGAAPELLAHHASVAGMTEPAVRYWLRAGEQAAARSANKEAASHLRTHRIKIDMLTQLGASSKFSAEWELATLLRDEGRRAASEFLDTNADYRGKRSTADLDVLLQEC
jgi:predicted ATPase